MTTHKTMFPKTLLAATALVAFGATANAFETTTTGEFTIYAGPMEEAPTLGIVPTDAQMTINGCLAKQDWCEVSYGELKGWAKTDVFKVMDNGQAVEISGIGPKVQTITYVEGDSQTQGAAALSGVAAGAAAGATVGGPVGGLVGALIGGVALGEATRPNVETITYVTENPVTPVMIEGELVAGAVLPEAAPIVLVPGTEYGYLYIDKTPVIVSPTTRQILYVVE